jgi:UV DNA damage endonuclease
MDLYDRIKATWTRKRITQKMHYSEPTPSAITSQQRRKHNLRVATLPPCPPDMDLMIEAKDKEQAVFELMRTFKLPGYDTFNDILPYQRNDENKAWKPPKKKTPRKKKRQEAENVEPEEDPVPPPIILDEEVGMGGPEGRVYWPSGMDEWLRPKKKEVKKRNAAAMVSTAEKAAARRAEKAKWQADTEAAAAAAAVLANDVNTEINNVPVKVEDGAKAVAEMAVVRKATVAAVKAGKTSVARKPATTKKAVKKAKTAKSVPTPSTSDGDEGVDTREESNEELPDLSDVGEIAVPLLRKRPVTATGDEADAE